VLLNLIGLVTLHQSNSESAAAEKMKYSVFFAAHI
jgi:hypothetical protein